MLSAPTYDCWFTVGYVVREEDGDDAYIEAGCRMYAHRPESIAENGSYDFRDADGKRADVR